MARAAGVQKEEALRAAGFSSQEIEDWKGSTRRELSDAGFSTKEIDEYFGTKEPDLKPVRQYLEENLRKYREGMAGNQAEAGEKAPEKAEVFGPPAPPQNVADTLLEALEAGWQMSVTGLLGRGKAPDTLLPEDAPMFHRIASQLATLGGDLPAMVVGGIAGQTLGGAGGAMVGSAVPGVGTTAGATAGALVGRGAGAFAAPAAIRTALMEYYEKGEIQDFGDFWERASAVFLETLKGGAIGGATAGVGGAVAGVAAKTALPAAVKTGSSVSAEIATMVTVGRALEGEMPKAHDFVEAAILVGGLHGVNRVAGKFRTIYARTGIKPEQVAERAQTDPVLKQDLLADGNALPKAYEKLAEPVSLGAGKVPETPKKVEPKLDPQMLEQSKTLGKAEPEAKLEIEALPKKPEPKLPEPPKRSEAESAVLSRIGEGKSEKSNLSFDEFYRNAVDDLHPLKQFSELVEGGKPQSIREDPYALARLTRGSYGKADQFLEFSPFKFETLENVKGAKPLKKILDPVKEDLDGFRAYAVAARTVELAGRGVESGVPLEAAKATVKAGKGKYDQAFKELVDFQNHTLTYLKDSGILSKETFHAMLEANRSYVPFFRLMDEAGVAKGAGKGLTVRNPVKAIKGSERQIVDPLESIIKNTYLYVTMAERNRVLVQMAKLAEKAENPALMERVKTPTRPVEVKAEEVAKFFQEHGIEANAEALTVFRPQGAQLGKNEIAVYRDGKREVYKVAPELAEAVKAMDRESIGLFTRILAVPAKTLRAGAVLAPDFMLRNLVRDQLSAFNLSKHGFMPVFDSLRGLGSIFKKDEHYQNWLKAGGGNSALVAIDRQYISQNVFKLSQETRLLDKAWNVAKSPLEMLRITSELIENSTRLGEFKRATRGEKSAEKLFQGALDSREVTLDFARVGAKTRAMNLITAFWNAHVQGLDRTARAFAENPAGMTAKVTASVTLPSVILWWANKDDPRWKEIPRWQKDLFWIVMTDEHIYRIPKPFELGIIFGSLPERVLENYFTENPKAFQDFEETILQAFTPSYIPTFALPVVEHFANKSTLTGGKIVPAYLEDVLPEYQYTEYTTETAKVLGQFVAAMPGPRDKSLASPAVLQNYIRAWSGNLGMYALQLADQVLYKTGAVPEPVKPAAQLADIPVIKAFAIRYPSSQAQSIQDFFDRYTEAKKVSNTIRHLARQGDVENLERELALDENQDKIVALDGIRDALSNQMKWIRLVHQNPEFTPDEKRQLIDGVYYGMIETAKAGNLLMDEMAKALGK